MTNYRAESNHKTCLIILQNIIFVLNIHTSLMSSLKHNLLLLLTSFTQKFHHLVCSLRPFSITANTTQKQHLYMMMKIVFIASLKKGYIDLYDTYIFLASIYYVILKMN